MEETIMKIFPILSLIFDFISMISKKISDVFFDNDYSNIISIVIIIIYIGINIGLFFLIYQIWENKCTTEKNTNFYFTSQFLYILTFTLPFLGMYLYQGNHLIVPIVLWSVSAIAFIYATVKNFIIHGALKGFFLSVVLILFSVISYPTLYLIIYVGIIILLIALVIGFFSGGEPDNEEYTSKKSNRRGNSTFPEHWYDRRENVYDDDGNKYKVGRSGDYIQDKKGDWHKVNRDDMDNPYLGNDGWIDNDKIDLR